MAAEPIVATIRGESFTDEQLVEWYERVSFAYKLDDNGPVPIGEWEPALLVMEGKIFQVLDKRWVLLKRDEMGWDVVALNVPQGVGEAQEGQPVKCLVFPLLGSYRYQTLLGVRSLPQYHYCPRITFGQFMEQLNRAWFPMMREAFEGRYQSKRRRVPHAVRPRLKVWDGVGAGASLKR